MIFLNTGEYLELNLPMHILLFRGHTFLRCMRITFHMQIHTKFLPFKFLSREYINVTNKGVQKGKKHHTFKLSVFLGGAKGWEWNSTWNGREGSGGGNFNLFCTVASHTLPQSTRLRK